MPKEITYSDSGAFLQMPDGSEYPELSKEAYEGAKNGGKFYERGVQVSWSRDQFAEIGVAQFDISREWPSEGTFITLDRAGINRLIRSLRKARDQAYGKDE